MFPYISASSGDHEWATTRFLACGTFTTEAILLLPLGVGITGHLQVIDLVNVGDRLTRSPKHGTDLGPPISGFVMVCQVVFTSIDIFIGVTVGRHDWAELLRAHIASGSSTPGSSDYFGH
ncbi:hypothetical protein PENARI_c001G11156 [Penicillium arizonense]|uniref:Uncharacterized protein n=1 Tax=Penicillium arizonense TaxID=1835702 RepID=A0A1F5LXS6_PENAI|nr:hypothetical protein PENARI_c001G11156 [Penicillium arizonense]OGE57944.1 hypothetical protein PENARI_c001G11156 [Penicillium arizonense]